MKKMSVWVGACLLIIFMGLSAVSCSKEKAAAPQGKDQLKEPPMEKPVVPRAEERAPEETMPPDHGQMAEKPGKSGMRSDQMKNATIARINGTNITMAALTSEMQLLGPQFIKDPSQKTPENIKKLKQMAFDILIFRELATQEATRQGMKIRRDTVDLAEKQLKENLGSSENYKKFLEMSGYDEASMRKRLEQDLLFERITDKEIFKKAPANDQAAIEKRKREWENELKKKARIEIFLAEVEKSSQAAGKHTE